MAELQLSKYSNEFGMFKVKLKNGTEKTVFGVVATSLFKNESMIYVLGSKQGIKQANIISFEYTPVDRTDVGEDAYNALRKLTGILSDIYRAERDYIEYSKKVGPYLETYCSIKPKKLKVCISQTDLEKLCYTFLSKYNKPDYGEDYVYKDVFVKLITENGVMLYDVNMCNSWAMRKWVDLDNYSFIYEEYDGNYFIKDYESSDYKSFLAKCDALPQKSRLLNAYVEIAKSSGVQCNINTSLGVGDKRSLHYQSRMHFNVRCDDAKAIAIITNLLKR